MQTFAPTPAVSAPPPATTKPFNPSADPDFLDFRIFHSRPIQSIIDQILANTDDVQMFSLLHRLETASPAEKIFIAPYIISLQKKNPIDRSGAEDLILHYSTRGVGEDYIEFAAGKGVIYAHARLGGIAGYSTPNWMLDKINKAAAKNNPHALVATARALINIIKKKSHTKFCSEKELQYQFNNLQKAASLGEPLANWYLGMLYCSQESDFPLLAHIVEKPFQIPNKQLAYGHYKLALKNGLVDSTRFEDLALELGLFGVAACFRRFATELSAYRTLYLSHPLAKASNHPEVIYHMGTLSDNFDEDPDRSDSVTQVFQKIREDFNFLASTQTAFFLKLLSWETEPDQIRIVGLLNEAAKQYIHRHKNLPALCAQRNALTARMDNTPSLAASAFSHWANANADNDIKRDSQERVVTVKPTLGKTG